MSISFIKNPLLTLTLVGVLIGVGVGYPLGNRTVTKVQIKTVEHNVSAQIADGESLAIAQQALSPHNQGYVAQSVGTTQFKCVIHVGHLNSQKVPTDWYDEFCAAPGA